MAPQRNFGNAVKSFGGILRFGYPWKEEVMWNFVACDLNAEQTVCCSCKHL